MQALQRDASQDVSASQVTTRKHKAREASPGTAADSAAPPSTPVQPPTNGNNPSTAAASHSQAGQATAVNTLPDTDDVSAGLANKHLHNHADQPAAVEKAVESGLVPAVTASKQRNLRAAKVTPASELKLAGVKRRTSVRDATAAGQEEQSQASHAGPKNKRQHTEAKPVEVSTSAEATEMPNKKPRRRTRAASLEAADNQTANPAVASAVTPAQTDAAMPTEAALPESAAPLPGKAVLLTEEVLPEEVAAPEGMATASDREKRRTARLLKPPAEGKQGRWFELLSRQRQLLVAVAIKV